MDLELKKYMTAIKKRFWVIVLAVLVACASAFFYSRSMESDYYSATTKLIVNKTSQVLGGEQMDLNAIGVSMQLMGTYAQIILSPAIMDKVVEQFPDLGLTSNRLMGMVTVRPLGETQVMVIAARDTNYARAAEAVNAVTDVFQAEIPKIMKVDNVTVLNKAKENEPTSPTGQNLTKNMAIAFLVAFTLATGVIVLLEYLDTTIKSEEEIWQLFGVQTFAVVPRMRTRDFRKKPKKAEGTDRPVHAAAAIRTEGKA
ncbi:Capsular polysaccharide biosynthesis protein [Cohnella sp. OV330]|uniref:YveK family protein n=1 Tax=Cohnella sp. OV330 TaxID=1855288 RepID=UPI0008F09BF6|nr:Wzz/FepE/Etk N-terminal domain-containing protein [Cohnella sp. OV330]SFA97134.1 Capsular polysaccharide biosynthesis protein [Cohnella sp. OV330]